MKNLSNYLYISITTTLTCLIRYISPYISGGGGRPLVPAGGASFFSASGTELVDDEDVLRMFMKERRSNGDFVSKVTDALWRRDGLDFIEEADIAGESIENLEEEEDDDGFLKLTKNREWVLGENTIAPFNRKLAAKLKKELLLLTVGIGGACTVYCLVTLSVEAAVSYSAGVLFSLSKEAIPTIFMQKKRKKIGIRSEDLQSSFERTLKGSAIALSSPRLVIPATIYGFWAISHNLFHDTFDFQLVPAMLGLFAYKAAALVQVYRDNDDLQLIFPDSDEDSIYN
ncbi:hypothetical protein QJS10_CPA16g01268 [Acorus calamus]|uniref:CGL160/ATPI domain-containing protein n=1 Tax=Acorus calamus TaxID=4465 RepID=A0AAV9D4I1_ACOCL|nr:hypothetical protein QJS10_CPA16g01268 [Acorus calamus]